MANPNDDIISTVNDTESEIAEVKKAHYAGGGGTRTPPPIAVQTKLNEELLNMLKIGRKYAQFQGIDRCIRVLDPGAPSQRHCMSMMVKDLTRNMVVCSSCDRIKDVNANPKTINSASIKLNPQELQEMHMDKDPLENAKPMAVKPIKNPAKVAESRARRPKVAVPNSVKIEVTMKELGNPDIIDVLLQKTLDAIFELPVKNFREAEEIRIVKERVEKFLNHDEAQGA
jgi:hypothetical protein